MKERKKKCQVRNESLIWKRGESEREQSETGSKNVCWEGEEAREWDRERNSIQLGAAFSVYRNAGEKKEQAKRECRVPKWMSVSNRFKRPNEKQKRQWEEGEGQ